MPFRSILSSRKWDGNPQFPRFSLKCLHLHAHFKPAWASPLSTKHQRWHPKKKHDTGSTLSYNDNIPWIPMFSENLPVLMAFTKGQCCVSHASLWGLQWPVVELQWSVADRHQAFPRCNCKGRSDNCCHSWNSSIWQNTISKKSQKKESIQLFRYFCC